MILDAYLLFTGGSTSPGNSDGKTDSPTTGTQESSNVVDLGVISGIPTSANGGGARDMGIGDDPALKLMINVNTAFTGGTGLTIQLSGAPDDGTGAPGSYTVMYVSPEVLEASLVAGARIAQIDVPRPVPGQVVPRFLRLDYVSDGTHNAGKLEGCIVIDRDDQIVTSPGKISGYPAGINIVN